MEEQKTEVKFKVQELCIAGACNRGIAYVGCFKVLEELEMLDLKKVALVSIGSFVGTCLVVGYSADELFKELTEKDINELKDFCLPEYVALLKGNNIRNWIYGVLSKKIDPYITFKDLYEKTKIETIIVATCIHSGSEELPEGITYFSHINTPEVKLLDAICSSIAFPFVFPPVCINGSYFIDGGVLDNFPMELLSENALGLRVTSKEISGMDCLKNPVLFVGKMFDLTSVRITKLKNEKHKNIVNINADDFEIIDFDMSIDNKVTLFQRGYTETLKIISNYSQ